MKNRLELAKLLAGDGKRVGAEIGVATGRYSEILLKLNPALELECVDDWANTKFAPTYKMALEKLSPYVGERVTIYKLTSVKAATHIVDGSLDFVYIDANHEYNHVRDDINIWAPKVKKGGIVAGDDYYLTRAGNLGVIKAINEYCNANGIELYSTLWDLDQSVEDDQQPNWWFIKP